MLRSPADEKKQERMSRLPELVRILRTYPYTPVIHCNQTSPLTRFICVWTIYTSYRYTLFDDALCTFSLRMLQYWVNPEFFVKKESDLFTDLYFLIFTFLKFQFFTSAYYNFNFISVYLLKMVRVGHYGLSTCSVKVVFSVREADYFNCLSNRTSKPKYTRPGK